MKLKKIKELLKKADEYKKCPMDECIEKKGKWKYLGGSERK